MSTDITLTIPLYRALWQLDAAIRQQFPGDTATGLAGLGINYLPPDKLSNGDYWCTPVNTLAFAWTGGDGEHFSFLVLNESVDDNSPVVLTAPANSLDENRIVARTLRDFLCLGLCRGFESLSQFAYSQDTALRIYGDPNWTPADDPVFEGYFVTDERQKQVASFIQSQLQLSPRAPSVSEFKQLQADFMPKLEMTEQYLEDL